MAVIVKSEITITKGFDHWKSMVFLQKERMAGMGMQFLFAGLFCSVSPPHPEVGHRSSRLLLPSRK